jgi:hypothetical protein
MKKGIGERINDAYDEGYADGLAVGEREATKRLLKRCEECKKELAKKK